MRRALLSSLPAANQGRERSLYFGLLIHLRGNGEAEAQEYPKRALRLEGCSESRIDLAFRRKYREIASSS
jgi:hypothetical protein